jgi:lipopolysaccharide transport system permease protein
MDSIEISEKKNSADRDSWTQVIRPQRAWWDLRLADVWRYRDLIFLMVWRDFVAVYKQTILGPLWHVIQPVLTTIIYTIIFSRVARLSTDGLPAFLFYMAGITLWVYFNSCVLNTSNTFIENAGIFGKVYFPRLSVPIAIIISNLISFGIRLGIFLLFMLYFIAIGSTVRPNLWAFFLPVLLLIMAGLGLGIGIIVSSLTTKYRDLQHLTGFSVQLLMYASPIIYPLSIVPENWRWLLLLNPITPVVEMFRLGFLGESAVNPVTIIYSIGFTAFTLLIGVLAFNHVENTFMDTV